MLPLEVTPAEVQRLIGQNENVILIDVREPEEFEIARIEGAQLIPMRTVPANVQKLEAQGDEGTLILICHHGVRSLQVASWLREQGIEACQSMMGGIERWSMEVDQNVPRY